MKVSWLVNDPIQMDYKGHALWSNMASVRYRCLIPIQAMQRAGKKLTHELHAVNGGDLSNLGDVVVVGKVFSDSILGTLTATVRSGKRVVADFCDNHFVHPFLGSLYRGILPLAHTCVVSTETMGEYCKKYGATNVVVISDPLDQDIVQDNWYENRAPDGMNLAWFGHQVNLEPLLRAMQHMQKKDPVCELYIATGHSDAKTPFKVAASRLGWKVDWMPWDNVDVASLLSDCDAAFLPTMDTPRYAVKSPNRIMKAICNGTLTITNHDFNGLGDIMCVNPDLNAALDSFIRTHPDDLNDKLREAQVYAAKHHSPSVIGEKWYNVLVP